MKDTRKDKGSVRKIFVVDTSLLLHDPRAILSFENNIVVVPFPVLEELDEHKRRGDNGTAAAARQVIRLLDGLREKGQIHRGVETPGGGLLLVDDEGFSNGLKLDTSTVDNFIISVAIKWRLRQEWIQKHQGVSKKGTEEDIVVELSRRFSLGNVALITKDINLRVKAGACRVVAQDYLKDRAVESQDQLYTGLARIQVPGDHFKEISRLICGKDPATVEDIAHLVTLPPLIPNQCCIFEDGGERCTLAIYKRSEDGAPHFVHVPKPKQQQRSGVRGIEPRNIEQAFAYALSMDTDVRILTFSGIAGAGKTLMALLAGLKQTVDAKRYGQILVYRSNREIGEPLGALKGGLKQKFSPWAQPIHDVLDLLATGGELENFETQKGKPLYDLNELFSEDKIGINPINFIQGRSFHFKFVIVDETQNFKPGDIKKVITRVGKGTKIILTGDVSQIENPYLDSLTNGLSHVIERMKGQSMFGHLTLTKSERSDLAEIAAKLL